MDWFNEVRLKQILTFPVETFAMVHDGKDIVDKEYKQLCAEMYAKGHSFFTYISDSADSLASCCRLRNEMTENTFSPTSGLTGVKTGSCNVISLNMNRIVQDWYKGTYINIQKDGKACELNSEYEDWQSSLKEHIINILKRVYKYHIAYKTMLYDWESKGMYASSNGGYIEIRNLFSTVGINGLKVLGLIA